MIKELVFADEDARTIFSTGLETSGMESMVRNVLNENDNVLIVNGGGIWSKICRFVQTPNINCDDIKVDFCGHYF